MKLLQISIFLRNLGSSLPIRLSIFSILAVICFSIHASASTIPAQSATQTNNSVAITWQAIEKEQKHNNKLDWFEDTTGKMAFREILFNSEFKPLGKQDLAPIYSSSAYWLRFQFHNDTKSEREFYLQVQDSHLEKVEFFDPNINTEGPIKSQGTLYPYQSRDYDFHIPTFVIPIAENETRTYYLRVKSSSPITIPIQFSTEKQFRDTYQTVLVIFTIHLSIILAMALYNQFLIFATRDINYFYYGLSIISTAAVLITTDGWQMGFFPDNYWINHNAVYFCCALAGGSLLIFVRSFFETHLMRRGIDTTLKLSTYVCTITLIATLFFTNPFVETIAIACALGASTLAFLTSIFALKMGRSVARFLVAGWAAFLIGAFFTALANVGIIPPEQIYKEALKLGQIIEAMLMSFALADRFRELKRKEQRAIQAAKTSDIKNQAKSEFLAQMSHEIRTPMNGVLGMAELLEQTELTPNQKHYVKVITSSGRALINVINDILDFSKVEAGKMELEQTPFDLDELIAECSSVFSLMADKKDLPLICSIQPDTALYLSGDPTRLRQILINLLGNAFKFTSEGQICLRVYPEQSDDENQLIRFEVTDTGIGISEQAQLNLFTAFNQADSSTSRRFGGTGLGLTISKQLAEMMGGEIGVVSTEGKGSTFWFTAQLNVVSQEPPQALKADQLFDKRLLIVDDNITYAHMLKEQARAWKMNVTIAYNGEEAIRILEKASQANEAPYDIVSLDLHMPLKNGLETAQEIQQLEINYYPQIMLLTASQEPMNEQQLDALDIKKATSKPISVSQLKAAYLDLLGDLELAQTDQSQPKVLDKMSLADLKVLVAEDNTVNQMVIKGMLEKLGIHPSLVDNGLKVVESIIDAKQEFDVILMDCEMPELNGLDATREIRQFEFQNNLENIPIIALTAHADVQYQQECREAGMDNHLPKPIIMDQLVQELAQVNATIHPH